MANVHLENRAVITKPLADAAFTPADFQYYDKDGFELCKAESSYYFVNKVPLLNRLNHICCQSDWIQIQTDNVYTDHSLILHRYSFEDEAREQLLAWRHNVPQVDWLLQTRRKWGFDIAIDATNDLPSAFEVVHIEYDDCDFGSFLEKMAPTKEMIERTDWQQAARQVWYHRGQWEHLKGFAQNHWKARYLFGWDMAEYTEKANAIT